MFGFFKKWFFASSKDRLYPECLWQITVEAGKITCIDDQGHQSAIHVDQLKVVIIETNGLGPCVCDFYWLLFDDVADDSLACCVIPQGATGDSEFEKCMVNLPGFDQQAYHDAIRSTDKARFVCWKKESNR
jgi:hypothetical protein